jgi:hypothetical protein
VEATATAASDLGHWSALTVGENADGALTLYVQKDSLGADKESNWLPAPKGEIYLVMRLYWPKPESPSILPPWAGTWQPPRHKAGLIELPGWGRKVMLLSHSGTKRRSVTAEGLE